MEKYNNSYWKKLKEQNLNGGLNPRSQNNSNRRSSFGKGQPMEHSVLSLEKQFCLTVGGVSWEKVLHTQKYMYQDEKVLHWKDSAVKEAFWNAKKRFWAKMLGHPCDIKLPDPDIFIDKIDWNSPVDPKLMLDLEKKDPDFSCETDQKDSGVVVGIPVVPEQYVLSPMGWGDAEEENPQLKDSGRHDHWGDNDVGNAEKGCSNYGWEDGVLHGTRDIANHDEKGWNYGESTWNGNRKKRWDHGYNKKWEHGGQNTSRYKVSQFHHNGYDQSLFDDYGGNKRGNFSNCQHPRSRWRPVPRQW